jgi:hypothetical protein
MPNTDVVPLVDNAYDIGASSLRWRSIYGVSGVFGTDPGGTETLRAQNLRAGEAFFTQSLTIRGPQPWVDVRAFGARGDGVTDDAPAIQAAINSLRGTGGIVFIPAGTYLIGSTITVWSRIRLIGSGSQPPGTRLLAKAGLNADMIHTEGTAGTEWWHGGEIGYLSLNGNRYNNTAGHAINVGRMGETSIIHHVIIGSPAQDGVVISGESTPSNIAYVSVFSAGGYGFNLNDFRRHAVLISPSGDANTLGLIRINGGATGAISSVVIIGVKAERGPTSGTGVQDPAILIDDFVGTVSIIGGSIEGHGQTTGTSAIKRQGASSPSVALIGVRISGYTNQYEDTVAGGNTISLGTGTQSVTAFIGGLLGRLIHTGDIRARDGQSTRVIIGDAIGSGQPAIAFGPTSDVVLFRFDADRLATADRFDAFGGLAIGNNGSFVVERRRGAAVVSDGGTIAHGLGGTPVTAWVQGSVAGEFVSVTAMNATNITVAIKKHDGTSGSTQQVYWAAER